MHAAMILATIFGGVILVLAVVGGTILMGYQNSEGRALP